ncbi:MAG: PH domain-containing protein [Planctomycetota bacterium]|jgi:putative membrane protein
MSENQETQVYQITRPHRSLLILYLMRSVLTGPAFPVVFMLSFFKYETLRYRFDAEGVTWRREIVLTYSRIQDIHLSRGLFERWLGLGTIYIQTAAGSASAEMAVVGLTEYDMVRDHLYSKMRGAGLVESGARDTGTQAVSADGDPALVLLVEIRDEIRALRARETNTPQ